MFVFSFWFLKFVNIFVLFPVSTYLSPLLVFTVFILSSRSLGFVQSAFSVQVLGQVGPLLTLPAGA